MKAVNPATGETLREYPEHDATQVEQRLARAGDAFAAWSKAPFAERGTRLRAAAQILRAGRDAFARLMTDEMGKPIAQAEAEIDKCAWGLEHFAEHGERMLAPETVVTDASRSFVRCDPLGAILAVMPWNFPFWQVVRAAAPALMAGNVVVLKHASNVPGSALALEGVFRDAGLLEGAFTTLLVPAQVAEMLVEHPVIRGVTLTRQRDRGRQARGARRSGAQEDGAGARGLRPLHRAR